MVYFLGVGSLPTDFGNDATVAVVIQNYYATGNFVKIFDSYFIKSGKGGI